MRSVGMVSAPQAKRPPVATLDSAVFSDGSFVYVPPGGTLSDGAFHLFHVEPQDAGVRYFVVRSIDDVQNLEL